MGNIFIDAAIISTVFFIIKFIEMRFVEKESKMPECFEKTLVRIIYMMSLLSC
jgi:hypothetical protein